jgi:hypothetical protein
LGGEEEQENVDHTQAEWQEVSGEQEPVKAQTAAPSPDETAGNPAQSASRFAALKAHFFTLRNGHLAQKIVLASVLVTILLFITYITPVWAHVLTVADAFSEGFKAVPLRWALAVLGVAGAGCVVVWKLLAKRRQGAEELKEE